MHWDTRGEHDIVDAITEKLQRSRGRERERVNFSKTGGYEMEKALAAGADVGRKKRADAHSRDGRRKGNKKVYWLPKTVENEIPCQS